VGAPWPNNPNFAEVAGLTLAFAYSYIAWSTWNRVRFAACPAAGVRILRATVTCPVLGVACCSALHLFAVGIVSPAVLLNPSFLVRSDDSALAHSGKTMGPMPRRPTTMLRSFALALHGVAFEQRTHAGRQRLRGMLDQVA
jgi:hypothetical protein